MNDNPLYLYAYADAPVLDDPRDARGKRSIIGEFDTRERPQSEPNDGDVVVLSLV